MNREKFCGAGGSCCCRGVDRLTDDTYVCSHGTDRQRRFIPSLSTLLEMFLYRVHMYGVRYGATHGRS